MGLGWSEGGCEVVSLSPLPLLLLVLEGDYSKVGRAQYELGGEQKKILAVFSTASSPMCTCPESGTPFPQPGFLRPAQEFRYPEPLTLQQRGIEWRGKGGRWGRASGWDVDGDDVGAGDVGRGSCGGSRGEIK